MSELLEALLEAHVQHQISRWRGASLERSLAAHVSAVFRWLDEVKLDDVATRAQVMGTIERYAVELRVGAGVAELVGEMSRVVLSSSASANTRVDQILPDASYEEFAAKVVSLRGAWRELVTLISGTAAFAEIGREVVSRTLAGMLFYAPSDAQAVEPSELLEPARGRAERFVAGVTRDLMALLARYLGQQKGVTGQTERQLLAVLDPARLRAVLDELWDAVSAMTLSEVFGFIDEHDLEDLIVLGYEFWLKYRKSPYFHQISSELVDHFFVKYGQESLAGLIDDMGVTEQMVSQELFVFLGPLIEHAAHTPFLEQQIRAQLESFYRSATASAILGAGERAAKPLSDDV